MLVKTDLIIPNPEQPRKEFDKTSLQELAESIRQHGVILPISIEETAGGMYILHDGERRLRAAKMAGLEEIPAAILPPLNGSGKESRLVRAMVANLQRSDLNPIEEAIAFERMYKDLGLSQVEISRRLGISYARVSQRLELLKLDKPIQKLISAGRLSKDNRLTKALLDISSDVVRIKTATALAERNASIKASIEACERVTGMLAASAERIKSDAIPAVSLTVKKTGPINRPLWDVFAQVGKVPPWLLVEISARNVCDRCGMREVASPTVCRGCALVEVLTEMVGRAK